jgi:thioredoxin reductase
MHDLIIIGGGAAALSATSSALGKHLNVLVIYEQLGGKTGNRLTLRSEEDYLVGHILVHLAFPEEQPVGEAQLAGEETVHLFERQVKTRSGVTLRDRAVRVTKVGDYFHVETARNGVKKGAAVVVATGVTPRGLEVPGAQEFLGMGIGYSPTTHAILLEGKIAAVIGTSERALRGAIELSRSAQKVFLIEPEAVPTGAPMVDVLKQRPNVEILEGAGVREVQGVSTIEQIVVTHNGGTRSLHVDAAFVDMGLQPNSELVQGVAEIDPHGFIVIDQKNETTVPGLFAAGDVTTAFGEQVLIAIGEGARAGLRAYDYLLSHPAVYERALKSG